jgi:spore coat protein U-like protein
MPIRILWIFAAVFAANWLLPDAASARECTFKVSDIRFVDYSPGDKPVSMPGGVTANCDKQDAVTIQSCMQVEGPQGGLGVLKGPGGDLNFQLARTDLQGASGATSQTFDLGKTDGASNVKMSNDMQAVIIPKPDIVPGLYAADLTANIYYRDDDGLGCGPGVATLGKKVAAPFSITVNALFSCDLSVPGTVSFDPVQNLLNGAKVESQISARCTIGMSYSLSIGYGKNAGGRELRYLADNTGTTLIPYRVNTRNCILLACNWEPWPELGSYYWLANGFWQNWAIQFVVDPTTIRYGGGIYTDQLIVTVTY